MKINMQRTPTDFYNALPSRKIELHDGKFLVGGSIEKTAMAMSFILNAYGAEYATQYIPKELLEEALIKVYGKPPQRLPIADYGIVEKTKGWNQLKTHLRLSFFRHKSLIVLGPDLVMRLEEDAWTPDIMILYGEHQQGLNSYYVDGPASLIVEMVNSATKIFDNSTRIKSYADGGVPEVWRIDEENQTISQLILQDGKYHIKQITTEQLNSHYFPTIQMQTSKLWDNPMEAITLKSTYNIKANYTSMKEGLGWDSFPYQPRFDLDPIPIRFEEYISWAGEAKFEFIPEPIFGGSHQSTLQFLGLCMMTLGIEEVVKYLPADEWTKMI